jgi:hypothetical protein
VIGIIGREIHDKDLCVRIVHRHAYLQIMAHAAAKQFLSKHMAQSVGKQQRMLVDDGRIAGLSSRSDAPFHDTVREWREFMFLFVVVHRRS